MLTKIDLPKFTMKEAGCFSAIFILYLFSYSSILQLDTVKSLLGLGFKTTLISIIVYCCIVLIKNNFIKAITLILFAALYSSTLYLNTKFGEISTGIISATLDTHPAEAFEYLSSSGISWQLLMIFPFLYIAKIANSKLMRFNWLVFIPLFLIAALFARSAYLSEKPAEYLVNILPEIKMVSLVKETFELRALENKPIHPEWTEVTHDANDYNYVVIIGESAQKKAFHFYGNTVKTTDEIADLPGWTVISDPVSPATQTRYSVIRLLSVNDKKETNQNLNIIDLAKMAGMKTYWFSNQGAFGAHDTPVTRLGKRADETAFHNIGFVKTKNDNVLIENLKQGLADNSKKNKMFFLHTIGSHVDFCQRLEDANTEVLKGESGNKDIDCYNGTIHQTISFIKEIQSTLQTANTNYKIIYLSDHGLVDIEEPPYKMHGVGHFFKKEAVEVPLIFITDSKDKGKIIDKTYYLRDFPHTFAQWTGISASQIDLNKSVQSDQLSQESYVIDHAQEVQFFN